MNKNTDSKKTQDYIFDLTDFNAVHFDYMDNYCVIEKYFNTGDEALAFANNLRKYVIDAIADAVVKKMQEPKWIPVSERLPKENIPVLLTVEGPEFFGKARREVILASYQRLYKDNYDWLTYEDEPSIIIDLPIAWMPLPEIYKAESEEE